jgi:hypothetical protein
MKKFQKLLLLLFLNFIGATLTAQDPDIQEDELGLEHVFRSSEQEGQQSTSRRGGHKTKRVSVPTGAFRIGCTCMDGTESPRRSTGACSGHKGVRYWLYRTVEGDTVRVLTGNHERHPTPLGAAEMTEIADKKANKIQNLTGAKSAQPNQMPFVMLPNANSGEGYEHLSTGEGIAIAAVCFCIYFTVRMLLAWLDRNQTFLKYALRNLLRSRKRPTPRKSRKNPPKIGM